MLVISAVIVLLFLCLHSFNKLLVFRVIAEKVEQRYLILAVVVLKKRCRGVVYPLVRLAADVYKIIAVADFYHILGGRLVVVDILAVLDEKSQLDVLSAVCDILQPVVNGIDRCHYLERFALGCCCAAACK